MKWTFAGDFERAGSVAWTPEERHDRPADCRSGRRIVGDWLDLIGAAQVEVQSFDVLKVAFFDAANIRTALQAAGCRTLPGQEFDFHLPGDAEIRPPVEIDHI